jgi:putative glutathione S-transferase
MSARDTTAQSDVGQVPTDPDGTFKRVVSTFRDVIERGGKFEPERGASLVIISLFRGVGR